ncbi:DUF817 domain-containing protein [Protaetiibacter intestinalis]|uniref:DUF817 domain-containing protein n=1 Tax=Protaetiibacter intestinalis TaxID=2419774 RepID=UPI001D042363|nr:DUF817 domain-containing protein [Protaetiibacter intestinalis]
MARFTPLEERIDALALAAVAAAERRGAPGWLLEAAVFLAKQLWACLFGVLLLVALVAARLWYPDDAALARNDLLTIVAVLIQLGMLLARLETVGELRVILLFHLAGTVMELFKTAAGSWEYDAQGVLRIAGVPLFSGFMYAAVGSYLVRVHRLFELRFDRYPRRGFMALVAAGVYVNFFTHHVVADVRALLIALVVAAYWPTVMRARVHRRHLELPLLAVLGGAGVAIWVAENIATWAGAWSYPGQQDGWEPVSLAKVGSWFLLLIVSVVLVTWVYPPMPSVEPSEADAAEAAASDQPSVRATSSAHAPAQPMLASVPMMNRSRAAEDSSSEKRPRPLTAMRAAMTSGCPTAIEPTIAARSR